MSIKINTTLVFVIVLFALNIHSQDIHFSHYYASPLTLNPANTGNFDGNWRFSNIFRNQWAAIGKPFRTIAVGLDKKIPLDDNSIGAGVVIVNDRSGDGKFSENKIYISGSFNRLIDNHHFIIGIQPGFSSKSLSNNGTTLPDQWTMSSGTFDSSSPTQETAITNVQSSFFDLNAGIMWTTALAKATPAFGISFFHLTQPRETFFNNAEKLPFRTSVNFSMKYLLSNPYFIIPHFQLMSHQKANSLVIGSNVGKQFEKNEYNIKTAHIGFATRAGYGRNLDALIFIIGANFKNIDLGISYDVTISGLKTATKNRGAFEISLIYTHPSMMLEKIATPCERM